MTYHYGFCAHCHKAEMFTSAEARNRFEDNCTHGKTDPMTKMINLLRNYRYRGRHRKART